MDRTSKVFKLLRDIDITLTVWRGLLPDFQRLAFVYEERKLFSDDGLIKIGLSMIPGTERPLKAAVKKLGGWNHIVSPSFTVTEEVYSTLESAGLSRERFNKTREYLGDPVGYVNKAKQRRHDLKPD